MHLYTEANTVKTENRVVVLLCVLMDDTPTMLRRFFVLFFYLYIHVYINVYFCVQKNAGVRVFIFRF